MSLFDQNFFKHNRITNHWEYFLFCIIASIREFRNFKGRSSKAEYFYSHMVALAILAAYDLLKPTILEHKNLYIKTLFLILALVSIIFTVVMNLSVTARRLHDVNRSGWWALIDLIPGLNLVLFLILIMSRGSEEINQYGQRPDF